MSLLPEETHSEKRASKNAVSVIRGRGSNTHAHLLLFRPIMRQSLVDALNEEPSNACTLFPAEFFQEKLKKVSNCMFRVLLVAVFDRSVMFADFGVCFFDISMTTKGAARV